jgi:hypothetical protein
MFHKVHKTWSCIKIMLNTWWTFLKSWDQMKTHTWWAFFKLCDQMKTCTWWAFFKLCDQMKITSFRSASPIGRANEDFYYLTISSMLSSYVLSYWFILLLFNNYEMGFFERWHMGCVCVKNSFYFIFANFHPILT